MVYVTGDIHGDIAVLRRKMRHLSRGDTLIICGDFGFVFSGCAKEKKLLEWIGKRKFNILFVDGVHDNLNLINTYSEQEWNGGMSRVISGNLRYLCRGHIFTIEDMRIFAFGGGEASSIEQGAIEWWDKLLPDDKQVDEARRRLSGAENEVDYIITHRPSRKIKLLLTGSETDINLLDTFFDEVRQSCRHKGWFFGSLHLDRFIPPTEAALFNEVSQLGGPIKISNANAAGRARKR